MTAILYGIPNCDTVKKARNWLERHAIDYRFHDFRKDGIDSGLIASWLRDIDWETLVNRKGTTWRALDEARKNAITDAGSATQLLIESPAIVKRPVLVHGDHSHVGFSDAHYQQIFQK